MLRNERKVARRQVYFLRNEHPSVSLAFPPVGWQRTVEQPAQMTTVCAWEKTVVMVKQPGHLTSMKKDLGAGTRFWTLKSVFKVRSISKSCAGSCDAYLQLVAASLSGRGWVEEINGENLFGQSNVSHLTFNIQHDPSSSASYSLHLVGPLTVFSMRFLAK